MEVFILIIASVILFYFYNKKSNRTNRLYSENNESKSIELKDVGEDDYFNPKAVVIDIETTGLIIDNSIKVTENNLENHPWNFPRIVQICWMLIDDKGNYKMNNFYIKQHEEIPHEAIAIHGITNSKCARDGWELSLVLEMLAEDVSDVDTIVGHNINFDYKVLQAEYLKEKIGFPFRYKNKVDTMMLVGKMMKKPYGFKISLKNAADAVFSIDPKWEKLKKELNFHDAVVDAEITAYLYYGLKDL